MSTPSHKRLREKIINIFDRYAVIRRGQDFIDISDAILSAVSEEAEKMKLKSLSESSPFPYYHVGYEKALSDFQERLNV